MVVHQVHIEETGVAPTMAMGPNLTQEWSEGKVLTIAETKAQRTGGTKGEHRLSFLYYSHFRGQMVES